MENNVVLPCREEVPTMRNNRVLCLLLIISIMLTYTSFGFAATSSSDYAITKIYTYWGSNGHIEMTYETTRKSLLSDEAKRYVETQAYKDSINSKNTSGSGAKVYMDIYRDMKKVPAPIVVKALPTPAKPVVKVVPTPTPKPVVKIAPSPTPTPKPVVRALPTPVKPVVKVAPSPTPKPVVKVVPTPTPKPVVKTLPPQAKAVVKTK